MSKKQGDSLRESVMAKISSGTVTMRPKWQYTLLTIIGCIVLVATTITTIYLTNLVTYKLRLEFLDRPAYGLRERVDVLTGSFPWLAFTVGVASILVFVWMFRKFDISYKFGRWVMVVLVILSIFVGLLLAYTGFNDSLRRSQHFERFYGEQHMRRNQQK